MNRLSLDTNCRTQMHTNPLRGTQMYTDSLRETQMNTDSVIARSAKGATWQSRKVARGMYYHVWFVTKYRKVVLEGTIEELVKNILAECITRHGYKVLELETNADHLHMLVKVKDRPELAAIVRTLKAVSAKEILRTPHFRVGNRVHRHFWARRYGWNAIHESEIENIREYIRNQNRTPHRRNRETNRRNTTLGRV